MSKLKLLIIILMFTTLSSLIAVGFLYKENKDLQTQIVKVSNSNLASTSAQTQPSLTPSTQSTNLKNIQVSTSKKSYKNGEAIEITIKNNSNQKLTYYGPVCGIVFERKIGAERKAERVSIFYSESDAQCTLGYFVEAGSEKKITPIPTIDANPTSGVYQVVLRSSVGNIYSDDITIN